MILELLQNIALLVTLSVGLQLLAQRVNRSRPLYPVAVGILFGAVAVIAMMTALHFTPGVIYDGRSIIVSLAGFIGGPVTATIAVVMSAAYRLYLGGAGAIVGVLVIIESALFGILFYYLRRRNPRWEHPFSLWLFGVAVQSMMLFLQLLLPNQLGWRVLSQIGPSMLFFYPLGFMVAALVLLESERRQTLEKMVAAHNRILEMVATRVPLPKILDALVHEIEAQTPEMLASVLIFDQKSQRLRHIAVAGLPAAFVATVDAALEADPNQAIYTAASQRQRVVTRRIATDIAWEKLRHTALAHGLHAGWAAPIFDPTANVLGVFALYYRSSVQPTEFHDKLIDHATRIAAIAITRHRQEEALRSERDFARQVMDTMGEGLSVTDADGNLTYANPALAALVGHDPHVILERNLANYVVAEDLPQLQQAFKTRQQGERSSYELRLQHSNGQITSVLVSGVPRIWQGQYQGAIAVVTDLTERKRAEQALRESEARYRLLVDTSPYAIGIYQDDKIVFANHAAAQLLGADEPAALLGLTMEQIVAPEGLEQARKRAARLLQGETGLYPTQNIYLRMDGTRVPVEVIAVPFSFGARPAVQVLVQDITERVRRQRELEAQAMLAQALSKTVELEPLLARILEAGIHAVEAAQKGSLMLADAKGALRTRMLHGYHDPRTFTVQFPNNLGYGARAFRLRQPLLIDDARSMPEITYVGEIEEVASVKSAIVAPLVVRDGVIGVMALDNAERYSAFNADDLRVLVNIATTAALVLERARLFEEVKVQTRQLAQIMETAPQGLILTSSAGRVLMANPLGARDLRILANAQIGDTVTHLGNQPLDTLLAIPPTGPWSEAHADNRIFEIIARPVPSDGAPEQWVVVVDDVTRTRQLQAQAQLQERLATVGQLAAGIAHDFNNILNVILLHAQMVELSPDLPESERQRVEVVVNQVQNATNLIRQILDFSRQAPLERQTADLAALLNDQVKLLRRTLPESIIVDLKYGALVNDAALVNADPTRLRQVIINLALNARDAMPDGGTITFTLAAVTVTPDQAHSQPELMSGDWVRLAIADTGTGIPPEIQPHIFDPFFTTKAPGKGTGLGLAQVHGIVTQHNGFITAKTTVGQGTTFTIYLPATPAAEVTTPSQAPDTGINGNGARILLVEDNAALRMALVDMLESLNYAVVDAPDGRAALAHLAAPNAAFALVLSDVVMPDIGGVALVKALRERDISVPVVLMSGHPLDDELPPLQDAGVVAWLPKPCPMDRLAQTIAASLSR